MIDRETFPGLRSFIPSAPAVARSRRLVHLFELAASRRHPFVLSQSSEWNSHIKWHSQSPVTILSSSCYIVLPTDKQLTAVSQPPETAMKRPLADGIRRYWQRCRLQSRKTYQLVLTSSSLFIRKVPVRICRCHRQEPSALRLPSISHVVIDYRFQRRMTFWYHPKTGTGEKEANRQAC